MFDRLFNIFYSRAMLRYIFATAVALVALTIQFSVTAVTGPPHNRVVVCYIGTWAVYRPSRGSFNIDEVDPNLCTHLVYAFAGLDIMQNHIKSLGKTRRAVTYIISFSTLSH